MRFFRRRSSIDIAIASALPGGRAAARKGSAHAPQSKPTAFSVRRVIHSISALLVTPRCGSIGQLSPPVARR